MNRGAASSSGWEPNLDPTCPTRRVFLRQFALAGLTASFWGRESLATGWIELNAMPAPNVGTLRLRLADWPVLNEDFGSLRLGTAPVAGNFNPSIFPILLVNRAPLNRFFALNAECTHEGCVVRPYNRASNSHGCPCHGSQFGFDGSRLQGPARFPLQRYEVTLEGNDTLRVEIPDWAFDVKVTKLDAQTQPQVPGRLQLRFRSNTRIEYEILFRESVTQPWRVVSFARSPTELATQLVFVGEDDVSAVYVDRLADTGFYAVSIRLRAI